ncbi:hypothetical protein CF166_13190 [Amycolatopsis sp. KNN50.9b]|nr:hypothetical protein CF166_13190 [Amycolatopsis sp. KNN50.9b]
MTGPATTVSAAPPTVPPLAADERFAVNGSVHPLPAYDAGRTPPPRPPGSPGADLLTAEPEVVVEVLRQRLGPVLPQPATVVPQATATRRLLGGWRSFPARTGSSGGWPAARTRRRGPGWTTRSPRGLARTGIG